MLLRQAIRYQVISPFVLKPLLIVPRFYSTNPKETFYTLEEVAKHDNEDDCWMVINGKVYDVTDYIDDHPGGDVILDVRFKFTILSSFITYTFLFLGSWERCYS